MVLFCSVLLAGCIQLPGIHVISDTPDPVIGQWIGGEPPASDLHVIFYDNHTFFSVNFYAGRSQAEDTGTWARNQRGSYSTWSVTGNVTNWTYDSFVDMVYVSEIPQRRYYRYKG